MLVICNGAIKSGSTWLYNILSHLRPFSQPDARYLTLRTPKHPCIRPDKLEEFLEKEDCVGHDYLSKNHFDKREHRDLLLDHENVYVFDIERDPKDVAVSHYYHECFRNGYTGTFEEFYWSLGREVASKLSSYHDLWRNAGQHVYISSYERLHQEFESEVVRIASVLGQSLTLEQVNALREKTSLASLRTEYEKEPRFEGGKFFRKGQTGDWRNHFDAEMLRDIERIQRRGIGRFDLRRVRSRLSFVLRK